MKSLVKQYTVISLEAYSVSGIKQNAVSSLKASIYATTIKNDLCIHKFNDFRFQISAHFHGEKILIN